jgi:diguanylate cyclase (GGDEF)-like protein
MRAWLAVAAAVALIAASVLFAAHAQETIAETNFDEALVASSMHAAIADQEWALDGFLITRQTGALQPYFEGGRQLAVDLTEARHAAAADALELAAVNQQARILREWQEVAAVDITRAESGRHVAPSASNVKRRDALIEGFVAANTAYSARLTRTRQTEEAGAALVPVWLIIGLGCIFGAVGWLFLRQHQRTRKSELEISMTQARFAEAMQVSEDQIEAHDVLAHHLETTIPDSAVIILNRNNSANRLEPTAPLPSAHPLYKALQESKPRSCLAIRLSRQYEQGSSAGEMLSCAVCGNLALPSTCQPLLVGGEVIGSVLVSHRSALTAEGHRRLSQSVSQAAPVLANLRNLALAERRAATDTLTGLPNRRAVDDTLKQMLANAARAQSPFSLVSLDIDHFKEINDSFGHERGDDVLAAFGALVRTDIRASDTAGRMGGEEFVLLLPETDRVAAVHVAEKIRQGLHQLRVNGIDRPITASFGIASYPDDGHDAETLARVADRALYSAKNRGRDRIETVGSSSASSQEQVNRTLTAA